MGEIFLSRKSLCNYFGQQLITMIQETGPAHLPKTEEFFFLQCFGTAVWRYSHKNSPCQQSNIKLSHFPVVPGSPFNHLVILLSVSKASIWFPVTGIPPNDNDLNNTYLVLSQVKGVHNWVVQG